MGVSNKIIHIAIAFDKNYLSQFYALCSSLAYNNRTNKLHLHVIATDVDQRNLNFVESFLLKFSINITFYRPDLSTIHSLVLTHNWTAAVYYRLLFPQIVPKHVVRLLYLDCDTLVLHDVSSLYNEDIGQFPVAAVYDNYVKSQPLLGIREDGDYFNSGVLLIDVHRWNEQQISKKATQYLLDFPERIQFVDQCALNAVLINNWKHFPYNYNCLYTYLPASASWNALRNFGEDVVVLHFTLQRPWNFLCTNRFRVLYFHYLKRAPMIKGSTRYIDFSWKLLPAWLKIRLQEFYFDSLILQRFWKSLKKR
jgi:lipopolysaccharide biosynthesis glycosyltransferase